MGQLILVRHAQASFYGPDYDELSALGREQARMLGEHWATRGLKVAAVHVGPLARQRQTCEIIAAVYRARRLDWPQATLLAELNEHEGLKLVRQVHGGLASAPAALPADAPPEERERLRREYFRAYARLMREWASGARVFEGVEPWEAFRARSEAALTRLCTTEPVAGHSVVAFSSGGLVSAAIGALLGLDAERIIDLSLVLRNTALTEISWTRHRQRLLSFNSLPHLKDPQAVTSV